ncbi:MAG: hypothetical protein ACJ752_14075 [Gaiellaceae bacterium]
MATGEQYGGHDAAVKKAGKQAGSGAAKTKVAVNEDVGAGTHDPGRKRPPLK